MKPLTEKVLKSGLVDKHMAQIMEKWGLLAEGSSDLVVDDALKNATKAQLEKLSEDIGDELERLHAVRETTLDLNTMRWPTVVRHICRFPRPGDSLGKIETITQGNIAALVDRMGRLFFRFPDVDESWFVPGFFLERDGKRHPEEIMEVTRLYVGEDVVALQVSVR